MKIAPADVRATIEKYMLADGMEEVIDLQKSHGSWYVDARNGREYLDLYSMFASMPIGFNHPYVMENRDRIAKGAINKVSNPDVYSVELAEFVDTVGRIAQPDYLPYAFYIEGGTLAVENALKVAFDWKVRKNMAAGKGEKGSKVIHFKECFHGRSGYTLSLTDSPDPRKTMYFPKFDWPRISNPKLRFPIDEAAVKSAEQESINEIKTALMENPDDIAAIILEPIQGEGGDNHFRREFFETLRTIADENDIMLIYDEVQSGVGITGKMWAYEHFGENARPDIICFGKKTQVCGIFASKRVDEVEGHVFVEPSRINSTFGGNITDMVRFTVFLEAINNENMIQMAADNGEYALHRLRDLSDERISNVRGRGLMCAFDLPSGSERDMLKKLILEEGALMLGCGHSSIRFRPHLNITQEEIDTGIEIIKKALKQL